MAESRSAGNAHCLGPQDIHESLPFSAALHSEIVRNSSLFRATFGAVWTVLACAAPGPPPVIPHVPAQIHLELRAPRGDQRLAVTVPWTEVRGVVGGGELAGADIILALDLSNSALHASGDDVDGDGVVGENRYEIRDPDKWARSYKSWVTDPDDSIARSEIATAKMLVRTLEPSGARFALVTYNSRAYIRTELGPAEPTLEALAKIRLSVDKTGSRLTKPLRKAKRILKRSRREGANQPLPAVLIFTDGLPTTISQRNQDRVRFRRLAEDLGEYGARVYVLGFGEEAPEDDQIGPILAEMTGGHHLHVTGERRGLEVLTGPQDWSLTHLSIANMTTNDEARAVRLFPDGSFDGFLKLQDGVNQIRVELEDNQGRSLVETRSVDFSSPAVASAEEQREGEAVLTRLRERLREIELAPSPDKEPRPERDVTVYPEDSED